MNDLETIAHCRQELRTDPKSLRFVQLADALRRVGRTREAEEVLADGLLVHGRLSTARLVLARVYADTDRQADALSLLDELYPKDSGNVAVVELYLELLVWASRSDEAAELLRRAELIGVSEDVRLRAQEVLEADLWAAQQGAGSPEEPRSPGASRAELAEPVTLPDGSVMTFVDPFAVPVVARRLEQAGRKAEALRVWEEVALVRPSEATSPDHLEALRRPAGTRQAADETPQASPVQPPRTSNKVALSRFLRAVDPEAS